MKNSKFVTYHLTIPPLPADLQEEVLRVARESDNIFPFKDLYGNFKIYDANNKIKQWVDQHFDWPNVIHIRTIDKVLHPHVDIGCSYICNFILEAGGNNVHTKWFDSVEPNANVLEDHILPSGQWVGIDVSQPHGVYNLEEGKQRIMLSIENIIPFDENIYNQQLEVLKEMQ